MTVPIVDRLEVVQVEQRDGQGSARPGAGGQGPLASLQESSALEQTGQGVAVGSLAQQPDASATITRTLFVGLAMIESTAIYCFVVSMILIFANPFWNHVIAKAAGK